MATSKEYLDFILEQLSGLQEITYRCPKCSAGLRLRRDGLCPLTGVGLMRPLGPEKKKLPPALIFTEIWLFFFNKTCGN